MLLHVRILTDLFLFLFYFFFYLLRLLNAAFPGQSPSSLPHRSHWEYPHSPPLLWAFLSLHRSICLNPFSLCPFSVLLVLERKPQVLTPASCAGQNMQRRQTDSDVMDEYREEPAMEDGSRENHEGRDIFTILFSSFFLLIRSCFSSTLLLSALQLSLYLALPLILNISQLALCFLLLGCPHFLFLMLVNSCDRCFLEFLASALPEAPVYPPPREWVVWLVWTVQMLRRENMVCVLRVEGLRRDSPLPVEKTTHGGRRPYVLWLECEMSPQTHVVPRFQNQLHG